MATDEELLSVATEGRIVYNRNLVSRFSGRAEDIAALRAVYNAGLSRAAEITEGHHESVGDLRADSVIDLPYIIAAAIEAEKDQA